MATKLAYGIESMYGHLHTIGTCCLTPPGQILLGNNNRNLCCICGGEPNHVTLDYTLEKTGKCGVLDGWEDIDRRREFGSIKDGL